MVVIVNMQLQILKKLRLQTLLKGAKNFADDKYSSFTRRSIRYYPIGGSSFHRASHNRSDCRSSPVCPSSSHNWVHCLVPNGQPLPSGSSISNRGAHIFSPGLVMKAWKIQSKHCLLQITIFLFYLMRGTKKLILGNQQLHERIAILRNRPREPRAKDSI